LTISPRTARPADATASAVGYFDLHCHLLPGVDDGCEDVAEALECIRMLSAAGFRGAVCTPHACVRAFPDNVPKNIGRWVAELQREVREAGLNYTLWAGAELRLSENNLAWFEAHGVPTLGESRAVLCDWWGDEWPAFCDATIDHLLARGYQPILAHPERMGLEEGLLERVLLSLEQRGVWLQGNLNSLGGGEGRRARDIAWDLLGSGRYRLLASDTHDPGSVPPRLRGLATTEKDAADGTTAELLGRRTRAVLRWKEQGA
jgi:protein-tyrosine phosphatase